MAFLMVAYPNTPGSFFKEDYYLNSHVRRSLDMWGDLVVGIQSWRGKAPLRGDGNPPFHFVTVLQFKSAEAMTAAFSVPGAADQKFDVINFTDSQPLMQVSEFVPIELDTTSVSS